MELETGSRQGRAALVGEGTPYRATVAPDDFGLRIGAPLDPTFQGADTPDVLFEGLLGMAGGFIDRLGGFAQGVKVTQLVRGTSGKAWATAARMDNCPSVMTPAMDTSRAWVTSRSSAARSL